MFGFNPKRILMKNLIIKFTQKELIIYKSEQKQQMDTTYVLYKTDYIVGQVSVPTRTSVPQLV